MHRRRQNSPNISREERAGGPILWPEDSEAVDERQEHEAYNGDVAPIGLNFGMIRKILLADALDFTGFAESKIHDATAYPADEA